MLVQNPDGTSNELTNAQLETGWTNGTNPGKDEHGHGTHVAGIAGGTKFQGLEGVAPEARFLLVKTDFINTDVGISWAYRKAGTTPCVVNMSLGHHFGSHDGTDAEERLHSSLTGQGKIVVISAGNEREDDIHIGGRFSTGQSTNVSFQVDRQPKGPPVATITLWYDPADQFEFNIISPSGSVFAMPRIGRQKSFPSNRVRVDLLRGTYTASNLIQAQIQLGFSELVSDTLLRNWKLQIRCTNASIGRLDGWFSNSGFGRFLNSTLIETARTIGLSATGPACIAVASHVTKTKWASDNGDQEDANSVIGRSSSFSSQGPTRNGQQKPDYSAPGQWITSALARDSELQDDDRFSDDVNRLLTIPGTSMAAPMVTGVVALLLQKKKTLTPAQVKSILTASAAHDAHTGVPGWNPTYGHGKINVAAALAQL